MMIAILTQASAACFLCRVYKLWYAEFIIPLHNLKKEPKDPEEGIMGFSIVSDQGT